MNHGRIRTAAPGANAARERGQGWTISSPVRAARVVPIEAHTTRATASHWAGDSRSPRKASPISAPTVGSTLSNVPKVFAGSRFSAIISIE